MTITSGEISASTHTGRDVEVAAGRDAQRPSDRPRREGRPRSARVDSDLPTFVVAVRHDGGWYVSPAYTALEYAREAAGGPAAEFGSAKAADLGADSPEHAVSDALHAWQAGNWDRLMALAPPDELPVYDYRAWIDKEAADTHPDFTIDKLSTSATVNGDTAVVKLDASGTTGKRERSRAVGRSAERARGGWWFGSAARPRHRPERRHPTVPSVDRPGGERSSSTSAVPGRRSQRRVPFGLLAYPTGTRRRRAVRSRSRSCARTAGGSSARSPPCSTALDATIQHIDERSRLHAARPRLRAAARRHDHARPAVQGPLRRADTSASVSRFDGTKGQNVVGEMIVGGKHRTGSVSAENNRGRRRRHRRAGPATTLPSGCRPTVRYRAAVRVRRPRSHHVGAVTRAQRRIASDAIVTLGGGALIVSAFVHWISEGDGSGLRGHRLSTRSSRSDGTSPACRRPASRCCGISFPRRVPRVGSRPGLRGCREQMGTRRAVAAAARRCRRPSRSVGWWASRISAPEHGSRVAGAPSHSSSPRGSSRRSARPPTHRSEWPTGAGSSVVRAGDS